MGEWRKEALNWWKLVLLCFVFCSDGWVVAADLGGGGSGLQRWLQWWLQWWLLLSEENFAELEAEFKL